MSSSVPEPGPLASSAGPATLRVLVIGYGNTLRGDDAVGPLLAERVRQEVASDRVMVLTCHQLTPELAADLADCDRVVFIDASREAAAGEIQCRPLAPRAGESASLVHFLGPEQLLDLARLVYGRSPEAFLVSVGGLCFDFGDGQLSPQVAAAVEPALERIRELTRPTPETHLV